MDIKTIVQELQNSYFTIQQEKDKMEEMLKQREEIIKQQKQIIETYQKDLEEVKRKQTM